MVDLERFLWPVKARPGDNWLGMVSTDGISVSSAVVIGLSNRQPSHDRSPTFQKRHIPDHLGLDHAVPGGQMHAFMLRTDAA